MLDTDEDCKHLWAEEMGITATHISQGLEKNQRNIDFLINMVDENIGQLTLVLRPDRFLG